MRKPDLIIGPASRPQTLRWHIFRWLGFQFSLHKWLRSDDDRALHDHSSWNVSLILNRGYWEIVRRYFPYAYNVSGFPYSERALLRSGWSLDGEGRWYKDRGHWRKPWRLYFRSGAAPHRIALQKNPIWGNTPPVWSLWLRGPPTRTWGFHVKKGWVPYYEYIQDRDYYKAKVSEVRPDAPT